MTGFRVALGGVQQREGVTPDLTAMGKIIGGGLPVGAFGGRAEVMGHLATDGPVYQAGTLSGNPLAMAAGIAALRILEEEAPYPRWNSVNLIPNLRKNTLERLLSSNSLKKSIGSLPICSSSDYFMDSLKFMIFPYVTPVKVFRW